MARRKASDKKGTDKKSRAASEEVSNVQADNYSIAFEKLEVSGDVKGDIRIGHTIGYTAEQVSVLLKQITTTLEPKKFDGRCPYKGLEVFEEEDAELFFGRERLVNELVGRVKESRTVFITGPSGSGKSSLVRAGLIHALKKGAIKGSDRWLYETMKPGREPLKDLALAFSRLKSPELQDYFLAHSSEADILNKCAESALSGRKEQRFVLFIDQFEEVFTQINNEEERIVFINMLAHAGTVETGRVIVLFAMRSDFISNCATYPALNELLSQEFRQIGAMQPDELVSAIALPAMHVGLPVEHELIAQIINDMRGEPDALPLMQFALKDLFDAKQAAGGVIALTLKDYLQHGGIHKSLERHADATFAKLSESEQELTRSIFSGLIEIGRGTQDTKRTALFDELIPANTKSEDVLAIVQKLADARLIITDEQAGKDTVTISHEKLIEAWPWLKKLVNENRDAIALQNEIASDAKEWEDHKRDASYLYTGARLANAREKLEANKLVLSGLAYEFVSAGQAQQRRSQRTRILGISIPIGVIFLIILFAYISTTNSANLAKQNASFASTQAAIAQANAEEAQKQAKIARSGELAAQAVLVRDAEPIVSDLLGVEAYRLSDNIRTRSVLLDNLNAKPRLVQYVTLQDQSVTSIAFGPEGRIVAAGNDDGTIVFWDAETRRPIREPLSGHTASVMSVAFSPNGKVLASGSNDYTIMLWDVDTHQPISRPLARHMDSVGSVAFSPDGKILASGGLDGNLILWDVDRQKPITVLLSKYRPGSRSIPLLAFSPDGKILASGSGDGIHLWDMDTLQEIGQPIGQPTGLSSTVAFSPNGKVMASRSGDPNGTITLWDVASQQPIGQPLTDYRMYNAIFSPDGKILAAVTEDNTIILWDVATRRPIGQPLRGHAGHFNIAFSPDGKTLVSGSRDHTVIWWDISNVVETGVEIGLPLIQTLKGHANNVSNIALSADGKTLASVSNNTSTNGIAIILWDLKTQLPIGQTLNLPTNDVVAALSPDGKKLAVGYRDGTIRLLSAGTQEPIGQPLIEPGNNVIIYSLAFSPDGNVLASSDYKGMVTLWNVDTHQIIHQWQVSDATNPSTFSLVFSPSGKLLASKSLDGVILWEVETQNSVGAMKAFNSAIAFSPDGKFIAVSNWNSGVITLWEIATQRVLEPPLKTYKGVIARLLFHPDGKTLVSTLYDKPARLILWDIEARQSIGDQLGQVYDYLGNIAFSPDGKNLITGGCARWDSACREGEIVFWDIDPLSWVEKTCRRVGRNFTRAEWAQYFPNENYRVTCSEWPSEPEITVVTSTEVMTGELSPTPWPTMDFIVSLTPSPLTSPTPSSAPTGTVSPAELININTASLAELETLPGIDPFTAQRIIDYREQNGPFTNIEDIINVSGIGPGTYEQIKDLITVGL